MALKTLRRLTPESYNELIAQGILPTIPASIDPSEVQNPLKHGYGKVGGGNVLPALWDDQIDEFFDNSPRYGGVISSDQIDSLPNRLPMGFIMNLDASDEPGSHWVAVYMTGDSVEYFDPLAEPPSADFVSRITKKIKNMEIPVMLKLKVNKIAQQHGGSHRCGYHSIRFLDDRMNDIEFPLASRFSDKKINNSKEGEEIIKDEFQLI